MIENVSVTFTSPGKMMEECERIREQAFAEFLKLCVIDRVIPSKMAEIQELMKLACIFTTINTFMHHTGDPEPPLLPEQLQCLLVSLSTTRDLLAHLNNPILAKPEMLNEAISNLNHNIKFLKGVVDE